MGNPDDPYDLANAPPPMTDPSYSDNDTPRRMWDAFQQATADSTARRQCVNGIYIPDNPGQALDPKAIKDPYDLEGE